MFSIMLWFLILFFVFFTAAVVANTAKKTSSVFKFICFFINIENKKVKKSKVSVKRNITLFYNRFNRIIHTCNNQVAQIY